MLTIAAASRPEKAPNKVCKEQLKKEVYMDLPERDAALKKREILVWSSWRRSARRQRSGMPREMTNQTYRTCSSRAPTRGKHHLLSGMGSGRRSDAERTRCEDEEWVS
jgi:hypothetical protein